MVLKNYYNMLAGFVTGATTKVWALQSSGEVVEVDFYGNNLQYSGSHYNSLYHRTEQITTDYQVAGICFGTGSTEPDINDVTLSGDIVTTLSGSTIRSYTTDETGMSVIAEAILTNTGSEPVTISEVGLINFTIRGPYTGGIFLLVERTVLNTPVTIPAGEIRKIKYTITLSNPAGIGGS